MTFCFLLLFNRNIILPICTILKWILALCIIALKISSFFNKIFCSLEVFFFPVSRYSFTNPISMISWPGATWRLSGPNTEQTKSAFFNAIFNKVVFWWLRNVLPQLRTNVPRYTIRDYVLFLSPNVLYQRMGSRLLYRWCVQYINIHRALVRLQ